MARISIRRMAALSEALVAAGLDGRGGGGTVALRLAVAAAVAMLAPLTLFAEGRFDLAPHLMAAAGLVPLAAAVWQASRRREALAGLCSSFGLAVLILVLSGQTGGLRSSILVWVAVLPLEAMIVGSRMAVRRATGFAVLAVAAALAGVALARNPLGLDPVEAAMPVAALVALVVSAAMADHLLGRRDAAARRIRDGGRRSRQFVDHIGALMTRHELNGALTYANAAARELVGAGPERLLGRGLLERVHVADRPAFLKALDDAAHADAPVVSAFRVLYVPEGEEGGAPVMRWLDLHAQRFEDRGGPAVICVMRDITAQRQAEEVRAEGQMAAVREKNSQNRFLATVSHELRTPLNAIIGFSEMLSLDRTGMLSAEQRAEYAKIIHDSGHHLLDVVNTLLDVSKIESGAMTIDPEPLDLAEIAQDCCNFVALKAQAGEVALERVVGPGLPSFRGDRLAVKQILINLLSNAVKFTPAGGRVVLAVVRDHDMIDLSVSDTGIGIAAADLPQLGDPFFQVRNSYDRAYEGTGLGLSLVRGLVGLHGGSLTIESAPGVGTRVGVRLPLEREQSPPNLARITTFARAQRRELDRKQPIRLTA